MAEFEEVNPWKDIAASTIRAAIDSKLTEGVTLAAPAGKALISKRYLSIGTALLGVLQTKKRKEAQEIIEETGLDKIFSRFLKKQPRWVVYCEVTDSMVSGEWGLKAFEILGRSYLYHQPDYGIGDDESLRILGAWEPAENKEAFRVCFMEAYTREWAGLCLPPAMGQWAIGPRDVMLDALYAVVKKNPKQWSIILDRLRNDTGQTSVTQLADTTTKSLGVPFNVAVEALRPYREITSVGTKVERDAKGKDITDYARIQETRATAEKTCRNFSELEARVFLTAFLHVIEPLRSRATAGSG